MERLSSPEQLDQLPKVVSTVGWLSLITVVVLLVMAMVWGFVGRIPREVKGTGMLIRRGGLQDVVTQTGGRLIELRVDVGDSIAKDQIVAHLSQPELREEALKAKFEVWSLRSEREQKEEFGKEELSLQSENREIRKTALEQATTTSEKRMKWLAEKQEAQKELFADGLITKQKLMDTRQEHAKLQNEIEQNKSKIHQLEVEQLERAQQHKLDLSRMDRRIEDAERMLATRQADYDRGTLVSSSYDGRVVEVAVSEGRLVAPGDSIVKLERQGEGIEDLEAVIFIPIAEGKKVLKDMRVHIAPSTVHVGEFGNILGTVKEVSDYPATAQAMMRILENEQLVRTLSGGGAPMKISVDLIPDAETFSGLKWSSGEGPEMKIQSGTLCTGQIIVEEVAPINYVIPLLKKIILGEKSTFETDTEVE